MADSDYTPQAFYYKFGEWTIPELKDRVRYMEKYCAQYPNEIAWLRARIRELRRMAKAERTAEQYQYEL